MYHCATCTKRGHRVVFAQPQLDKWWSSPNHARCHASALTCPAQMRGAEQRC